jgi:hypothetical protein
MSHHLNWERIQQAFGYTDEEMEQLKRSPKHLKVLEAGPRMIRTRMIAEVVENKGCEAHQIGDKYVFAGTGRLLQKESCQWLCTWAIAPLLPLTFVMYDRLAEGLDPGDMVFSHVKCLDMGLRCGGFGEVLLRVSFEEREPRPKPS